MPSNKVVKSEKLNLDFLVDTEYFLIKGDSSLKNTTRLNKTLSDFKTDSQLENFQLTYKIDKSEY